MMDNFFQLHGINFIWNDAKARENHRKHHVSFEQAAEAFFDPFLKVIDASRQFEKREAIIGLDTDWHLLFVVHMEVEEDHIRIISARETTRQERLQYEHG